MGIIFLSEEDLRVEDYVTKFLNELPEDQKSVLEPLIMDHLFGGKMQSRNPKIFVYQLDAYIEN